MRGLRIALIGSVLMTSALSSCRKEHIAEHATVQAMPPDPHYHFFENLRVFGNRSAIRNGDGSITICAIPYEYQPTSFALLNVDERGSLNWRVDHSVTPATFAYACVEVPSGGWLVTGTTTMDYGNQASDIVLFKLDNTGGLEWTRSYGSAAPLGEAAYGVVATNDGSFVLGATRFSDDGLGSTGYLLKIDANGDTLWTRIWPGPEATWIAHVLELQNGDLLISGSSAPDAGSSRRPYIARLSPGGFDLWDLTLGAAGRSAAVAIESPNGDIVVGGRGFSGAAVFKVDASGTLLWEREFGHGEYLDERITALALLSDGSIAACGICTRSFDPQIQHLGDMLVACLSSAGEVLWSTTTFGDSNILESSDALLIGSNDTLIMIGNHRTTNLESSSVHLTRLGPDGGFE
jgi:hypothetical protein